jgi:hypothetical protein
MTERDVARLLDSVNGDERARLHRLSIAAETEREPIASSAAQRLCDAINERKRRL